MKSQSHIRKLLNICYDQIQWKTVLIFDWHSLQSSGFTGILFSMYAITILFYIAVTWVFSCHYNFPNAFLIPRHQLFQSKYKQSQFLKIKFLTINVLSFLLMKIAGFKVIKISHTLISCFMTSTKFLIQHYISVSVLFSIFNINYDINLIHNTTLF